MNNMNTLTLESIRLCKTFEELKPAVKFLCDNMESMAWGDFMAYKRTLESQTLKMGLSLTALNEYAENFKVFGYETK